MKAAAPRRWPRLRPCAARLGAMLATLALAGCVEVKPWDDERKAPPAPAPAEDEPPRIATAPANGFGDGIAWRTLEQGLAESKSSGRPLMLVVHASWCSRCKELKPKFHDERLAELSQQFVMVNADQDLTPQALQYSPDGQYIPRVLFFDPATGTPDAALQNPTRSKYHYYYGPDDDLTGMMEKALARHGKS